MSRRPGVWFAFLPLLALAGAAAAQEDSLAADLEVLKTAGVAADGPGLLAFFKKRTPTEETRTKIASLIRQLGGDEYVTREKATNDLIDIGPTARPMLSAARKDPSPEVRRRAGWALEKIGPAAAEVHVIPAAARVLAQRKPPGAAETLLEFLPNIENGEVAEEAARGLAGVALSKDGKPAAAVLLALGDAQWIKRYAAADALARVGGAAHRPAVRKLLKDADPGVRRRVAVSLLEARDKEAVPALIAVLTSPANDDVTAAEEALNAVAGEKAPSPPADDTAAARRRYCKAWESWWKEQGGTIDLAKIDLTSVARGYTLLALLDGTNTTGKVQELDSGGKVRWTIAGLRYPIWASMTKRDRVLICEHIGNRVTERDLKGRVIWEKVIAGQVLSAQRLASGGAFIAARNLLMEVDRAGNVVRSIARPFDVLAAERHKDGTMTLITSGGQCAKLDTAGTQTSSFSIGFVSSIVGFKPHFLPRGGVVVPDYMRSKIREYDGSGKLIREVSALRPNSVTRLPNGHLLVGSRITSRIYELDKAGNQVSSQTPGGRPLFVDRR